VTPIRVKIPIQFRFTPEDLLGDGATALIGATHSGVSKALRLAGDEALLPRGDHVTASPSPPTFAWRGDALNALSLEARHAFQERVAETIQRLVAELPRPEQVDSRRPRLAERPSVADVPLASENTSDLPQLVMRSFSTPEAVRVAIQARIDSGEMDLPSTGLLGVVFRYQGNGQEVFGIGIARFPDHVILAGITLPPLEDIAPPTGESTTLQFVKVTSITSNSYRLRLLGRTSSRQGRADMFARAYGLDLRRVLGEAVQRRTAPHQFEQAVERAVADAAYALADRIKDGVIALFTIGPNRYLFNIPEAEASLLPGDLDLPLVPLVDLAPPDPESSLDESGRRAGRDPFQGEPPVSDFGERGQRAVALMEEIAGDLSLERGDYGGALCVAAGRSIARRAFVRSEQAMNENAAFGVSGVADNPGAMGDVMAYSELSSPPALSDLRQLAATIPKIRALSEELFRLLAIPENARRIGGFRHNEPLRWQYDLLRELRNVLSAAVAELFAGVCRVIYLQRLQTSGAEIRRRSSSFANFSELFAALVMPGEGGRSPLETIEALERLRITLRAEPELRRGTLARVGEVVMTGWRWARRSLEDVFNPPAPREDLSPPPEGGLLREANGEIRISDGNRTYNIDELETAIATRRSVIESIDPLVRQIASIPEFLERMRGNRAEVDRRLRDLLKEMEQSNAEQIQLTREDPRHGFRMGGTIQQYELVQQNGTIRMIQQPDVRGSRYVLQGIHRNAHELLSPVLGHDSYYVAGMDFLFGSTEGARAIQSTAEGLALLVLSVATGGAGALAVAFLGGAGALHHLREANRRVNAQRALIDPAEIFRRGELEAELFAAELSAALAFLQIAGLSARLVGRMVRSPSASASQVGEAGARLATGEGRSAIGRAASAVSRAARIPAHVIEELKAEYVFRLIYELSENEVQDRLMNALLIGPTVERLEREFEVTGPRAGRRGDSGATP
jgi:uncharacterized coiled-coil protein SlyX